MPDIDRLQLHTPTSADLPALLAFELENRAYFETWVTARPPAYYTPEGVAAAIEQAQRERQQDSAHQYLAKLDGKIVGRVNLTAVTRPYFNRATLGYRIGEQFGGRGYATRVVALLLEEAFGTLELWRLEATARPQNLGSVAVMQRNGFHQYGRSEKAMRFHDAWSDLLYFERRNDRTGA
ncbi:ribosomal-protein-alanine N-acetyltransferase [Janthinobacterium sp. TND4EL3]|uniref:GNAT family N-acetyltransferase n=1 Tax=Janthinobacterium sp. TND4EL3 TaxID=1907311 RepID=UPI000955AF7A|nr:GNAT family protein [Janthinobacterium sp. TND4EL3]SIR48530.1 ribosomal-protein-alanine N-acetyltransferase [Janthinobacterium sp. TND4EL3]